MEKQNVSIIQKLSISYECALAIGNSLNLSEMLHEVIHTIVHKTNAQRGVIWLKYKQENENISLGARAGLKLSDIDIEKNTRFFREIFENIWENQQPVIKHRGEKDFLHYCNVITGKEQAALIIPVKDTALIQLVYARREHVDETLGNVIFGLSGKLSMAINACLAYENIEKEIQARRKTEDLLKDSEQQYRTTIDSIDKAIFVVDENLTILILNHTVRQWYKEQDSEREDLIGRNLYEVFPFLEESTREEYRQIFQTGEMLFAVKTYQLGGKTVISKVKKIPLIENDKVMRVVTVMEDITEEKRAEQIQSTLYNIAKAVNTTRDLRELFASIKDYLGKIIDTTNFYVALYDRETDTISLPYQVDEKDSFASFPSGKTLTAYVIKTGESLLATGEIIEELHQAGQIEIVGSRAKIWLGVPLKIENRIIGIVVVQSYTDASLYTEKDMEILEFVSDEIAMAVKHKRAEEELASEKERLAVTLRSVADGVITTGIDGKIILLNKVAEALTGWTQEEAAGRPLDEVFHIVNEETNQPYENYFQRVIKAGGAIGPERDSLLTAKDGTEKIIADSGAPIRDREGRIVGVVLVFRDITEKRKIEEELLKASKLESIGILAGGIAHDFNNILTGIIGRISLAKLYEQPGNKVFEALTKVEKAALQAKKLTRQLLTFARGGTPIMQTTSVAELITESVSLTLRGSNVSCEFSIPPDLCFVNVDEGQMSQVINNLTINADQAMPGGGIIKVAAENISVANHQGLPLKKGKYVKITLKDEGTGIPKEHLEKIFDPYFTTKQKGSGLGLSITYSIIKRHKGHITVESEVGEGTSFSIYLPASYREIPTKKETDQKIISGSGRILVMDDEEVIRDIAGEMLNHIGYEVELARDGKEAIRLYREAKESGNSFNAVILDLTVSGGMGGVEAMKKLLEIDPGVKAIVSSGYSNDPVMANFREYGFADVAPKPYIIQKLGEVLRKVTMSPGNGV